MVKLPLNRIKPNKYKSEINGGELNDETIEKIRSNLDEIGLFGSLPVYERDGEYFLVAGHHRHEALRREYGDVYEVEVTIHEYDDDQLLRGMVVENLTQRQGEFREELANLLLIRKHLKETAVQLPDSSLKDGRKAGHQHMPDFGSVRQISEWLNKQGTVMSKTRIADLLKVHDNLKPEILEKVDNAKKNLNSDVVPLYDAVHLAALPQEEQEIALSIIQDDDRSQRERHELLTTYKNLDDEQKKRIISGEDKITDYEAVKTDKGMSRSEMALKFNKKAAQLSGEMRDLRRTLHMFRRDGLYDNFTPVQKNGIRTRLLNIEKTYGELVEELRVSMEVLE